MGCARGRRSSRRTSTRTCSTDPARTSTTAPSMARPRLPCTAPSPSPNHDRKGPSHATSIPRGPDRRHAAPRRVRRATRTRSPPRRRRGTADRHAVPETTAPRRRACPRRPQGPNDGTLTVPDDYATIQAAVDAAAPGDLILVEAGYLPGGGAGHHRQPHHPRARPQRGRPRRQLRARQRHPRARRQGRRRREHDRDATTPTTGSSGPVSTATAARTSPRYRTGDYGVYAFDSINGQLDYIYAVGQPRRRRLHRRVLPVQRSPRPHRQRAQRSRLLGHQLRRQPAHRQLRSSASTGPASCPTAAATSCATRTVRPPSSATSCTRTTRPTPRPSTSRCWPWATASSSPAECRTTSSATSSTTTTRAASALVPFLEEDPNDEVPDDGRVDHDLRRAEAAGARPSRAVRRAVGLAGEQGRRATRSAATASPTCSSPRPAPMCRRSATASAATRSTTSRPNNVRDARPVRRDRCGRLEGRRVRHRPLARSTPSRSAVGGLEDGAAARAAATGQHARRRHGTGSPGHRRAVRRRPRRHHRAAKPAS